MGDQAADTDDQSPVREGDIIAGKYRVERVLGVGGMGVVVAAKHIELGELFALKFLLPKSLHNKEVAARFAREARTAIRVKNEHVARVFDVGTMPDGAPYMVMEHLTGEDLSSIIERRGKLSLEETVDYLLQACEALCEAHHSGIVHRDLKPPNLFIIAGSDGLPFVKVLDFGISKSAGAEGTDLSMTSSASILGSPLYMSPEQLSASKDVDKRSDIWSLGIILYEALTGQTPFRGATFAMVGAQILIGKFEPASKLRPGLPPAVDAIIASTLTSDRAARLGSVEAFAKQLAPFGTQAARTSAERIARIAGRASITSEAGAGGVPTTSLADTAALVADGPPAPELPTASPAPAGRRALVVAGGSVALGGLLALGWALLHGAPAPPGPAPVVVIASIASTVAPSAEAPSTPPAVDTASASAPSTMATDTAHTPPPASSHPARPPSKAEALTRAFARRESDVAHCFDSHGADLAGSPKIAIRFTVDVDGHVKAAQVSPPEVAGTGLGQCLGDVAKGTQFSPQAEEVSFRIPIAARRGS